MKMRKCLLGTIPLLFVLSTVANAQELPRPTGFVSDLASVIDAGTEGKMEGLLRDLAGKTGVEIAVVTVPSVPGGDVDGYAVKLFERWGIGGKGVDSGLLILASIEDRRGRIEVGYGLEDVVPDAFAGRVLREDIFPRFKEGNYGEGLFTGALILVDRIAKVKNVDLQVPVASRYVVKKRSASLLTWILRILFFIGAAILFIKNPFLFLLLFGLGGRGGFGGGFGGGGFGGFGGGLSGGGGAGGRW